MVTKFKQQDVMQINFNFTDSIVLNYDILYFVLNNKCYNECFPDKKLYIINYHQSYEFTNPLIYIIKKKLSDKTSYLYFILQEMTRIS